MISETSTIPQSEIQRLYWRDATPSLILYSQSIINATSAHRTLYSTEDAKEEQQWVPGPHEDRKLWCSVQSVQLVQMTFRGIQVAQEDEGDVREENLDVEAAREVQEASRAACQTR